MTTFATYPVDQSGEGTTEVVAAPSPTSSIRVISYVILMDGAGSVAFSDGTDWMSGDMPLSDKGGISAAGTIRDPLLLLGRGRPLQITTVGGSAHGHVTVDIR